MAVDKNKLEEEASILRFYKIVLSWDYLRLLKQSGKKNSKNIGEVSDLGLKHVKDTYKDVDEYLGTFEPLLFEEVKAQILEGKDDEEKAEWKFVVPIKCSEADGFHLLTVILEDVESVKLNDLLLLSEKQFGDGTTKLPTKYAFGLVENRHDILGQVTLRLQLRGEVKQLNADDIEPCPRLLNMRSLVSEESKSKSLNMLKICSLSTIVREYVALRSISSLPFKDLILAASERNYTSEDQAWEIPRPLMESIESNHNKSQLDAIRVGVSRKRLVLIQNLTECFLSGPPWNWKNANYSWAPKCHLTCNSSKSKFKVGANYEEQNTDLNFPFRKSMSLDDSDGAEEKKFPGRSPFLGLGVTFFLFFSVESRERYNHWEKASPWLSGINPRDAKMPENGDDGFFPTSGNELKPEVVNSSRKYRVRVLVCAPSNSALDEIVLRLLNTGIRDENNRAYNPKIVRIGLKPHHSVQTVSMDYVVEQKLAGVDFQTSDKHKQGGSGRERDSIRASILDEAAIVFSTLSFSGSVLFSKINRGFDVVIIDEAAQAVEPATLVPLANGCKQLFLVGDPVQLPATVISPIAEKFGYGMSLFKRFQRAGYQIRSFPSREFYDGELEDGPDVVNQTKRSWHDYRCFGPFCFFDIHEGKESQPSGSGSWVNEDEVDFVLAMYHKMVTRYPELKSSSRLAIISPYRHQVKIFRDRFRSTFGVESDKVVDINTVDGFQGREKDVAIFSCVRASKEKSIGFVADFRRMNVGITRARSSVLVSKPYREFFSDENIKFMAVKVLRPEKAEAPPSDEMEVQAAVPIYGNSGDMDQEPADDPYGDGDGDADGYDMGDGED
ncbi:hypothetical protein RHMOL_Rhmol05G0257700 [Rhododendron molle]|uniref:Uncharacterized protein n=1 Tax=Rhododendron molle TaxID=49168 RepID=A0ACC0NU56_RHOML|nr:hypothetical protein RHMOL_Rhmol05G0257700 [Rhododendron molle]